MHSGSSKLRDRVLPAAYAQVAGMLNTTVAGLKEKGMMPNTTLALDAWSSISMESLFACVAIFPLDRAVHLLSTEDASLPTHHSEYIRGDYCCCRLHTVCIHDYLVNQV